MGVSLNVPRAMDFAVRKARAEGGRVDDDLGTCLAIGDSTTGCMRATSAETEGATDGLNCKNLEVKEKTQLFTVF